MRKTGLTDEALRQSVAEIAAGSVDANLGGNLVKKRIALPGRGKRGGARTIIATNLDDRWFFLFGFAKNERANIDADELEALQELAKQYLALDEQQLDHAVDSGTFSEINDGNQEA